MRMASDGKEDWATSNIAVPPWLKSLLSTDREYPNEPFWRIIQRFRESYVLLHPKTPPQPAPEVQS